jgi:hypothetical protein
MSRARQLFAVVLAISGVTAASVRSAPAAPPQKPGTKPATKPPPAPPPPPPPLAILPSIARVNVISHGNAIAVIEDINLPRGEWKGETLRFHVAFGAPGPRAIDARLVGLGDGELEPADDETGEVLVIERVPRRPTSAHPLLGRETMAGIVVTVPADTLTKAFSRGNMASLRIRSLVDATEPDPSGASSIVVRLGASRGTPLTLGRITATAASPASALVRAEARLCGVEADPHPLAVGLVPRPAQVDRQGAIAPVLAVRRATDDLCVRLWHAPPKTERR